MENEIQTKERKKGILTSFLLFLIAIFLLSVTAPIGFIFALLQKLFTRKIQSLRDYLLEVALVLDQAGNVIMQHFLNAVLLKKDPNVYLFGNKKETISSVIGKNSLTGNLTSLGQFLDSFLNAIDKNHTLNSIEENIKNFFTSN
jgi:8-oxo-dGTP diphosphatase